MGIRIDTIKPHESNPRFISGEKMASLITSIKEFPEMMHIRQIIVDEKNIILGGNMRYKALVEMGYDELPSDWVKRIKNLTENQKREFVIKDNVAFEEWDIDSLMETYEVEELKEWGVDRVKWVEDEEFDVDEFFEADPNKKPDHQRLILKYSVDQYEKIIDKLGQHEGTPEEVIFKLLGC